MANNNQTDAFKSNSFGVNASSAGIGSFDNIRRLYNFGDRVAELAPEQSPWFVYLSKVAKATTNDPVFKFLEHRHQWQRRNFQTAEVVSDPAAGGNGIPNTELNLDCLYDKYGKVVTTAVKPEFILPNQILAIKCQYDANGDGTWTDAVNVIAKVRVVSQGTDTSALAKPTVKILALDKVEGGEQTVVDGARIKFVDGWDGEVIGSAFAEASSFPDGWKDELYAREGYTQIFKTAMQMMSNTARATVNRGYANEWTRIWKEKLMEHKMDIEKALLFGVGSDDTGTGAGEPLRYSWGLLPYVERYGNVYKMDWGTSSQDEGDYAASFDGFLEMMESFYAPEKGNSGRKLALCSRSVISYFNKLGNTTGASLIGSQGASAAMPFALDTRIVNGKFGHRLMEVDTVFGGFTLVQEPLFRGAFDNTMVLVDMANVKLRTLAGNGINRDTSIETNVQTPGTDGRIDQILTECGLEISNPETHAVIKFDDWS
tara:strand:- start:2485 stop:3942 length:1458 start_codon:yes stop_codon:yes gene_type:complete